VIVYGRNAVREALRAGRRPVGDIVATAGAAREDWLPAGNVRVASEDELTQLAGTTSHQGICADAGPYPYADATELLTASDPLIVVLDEIQDPQNLGAIVRTAEGAGATGVVIPERRSAEVTPAVCKASAGAVEWARLARVRNVADYLGEAKRAGCWCYGAAAGGGTVDYLTPDYSGGVVLVLGAEGKGLRPRVAGACDALVSLPLRGNLDSLNVSAAAAALLYGILQKRVDSES
jgi:23S rRNA (guanosine2251-2'-O)-methyltransferase